MYSGNGNDVCAVLFVEVVKVGCVLEVVCVTFAAFNYIVRNDIIRENIDFQRDVFFCEDFLYFSEYLGVRCGRCGNLYLCAGKRSVVNGRIVAVCEIINRAYNGAVIFVCYEIGNLLAFESRFECLYLGSVLVAFFNGKNVCVFAVRTFDSKGILCGIEACGNCVV